jgi:hypothetical protein
MNGNDAGDAKDMTQHVSVFGVLFIVFGALGIIAAIFLLVVMGGAASIISIVGADDPEAAIVASILGILGGVLLFLVAALSIPGLVVGIGLVKFQNWAHIGGLILCAVNLLNFPLGAVLGVYGLWVLLSKETEAVFT